MRVVLKNIFRVKKPTRRLTEEDEGSSEMLIQAWLPSPPAAGAAPGAAPRGVTRDTLEHCFPGISEPNPHPEVLQAPGQWEIPLQELPLLPFLPPDAEPSTLRMDFTHSSISAWELAMSTQESCPARLCSPATPAETTHFRRRKNTFLLFS